jgi:hypothetical protein
MLHQVTVKDQEDSQQKLLDQYELREYQVKYIHESIMKVKMMMFIKI